MASCFHVATLLSPAAPASRDGDRGAQRRRSRGNRAVLRKPAAARDLPNAMRRRRSRRIGFARVSRAPPVDSTTLPEMLLQLRLLPFIAAAAAYYLVNTGSVAARGRAGRERPAVERVWKRNFSARALRRAYRRRGHLAQRAARAAESLRAHRRDRHAARCPAAQWIAYEGPR